MMGLEPWQWFVGAGESGAAYYVTVRFLVWRKRRAVVSDKREGQPLSEHLRWIAEQDAKAVDRRDGLVTGEDGRDYRLPIAYKCAQCGRMGSLGSRSAIGGRPVWWCINCIHERMPKKARIWHQMQDRQEPPLDSSYLHAREQALLRHSRRFKVRGHEKSVVVMGQLLCGVGRAVCPDVPGAEDRGRVHPVIKLVPKEVCFSLGMAYTYSIGR